MQYYLVAASAEAAAGARRSSQPVWKPQPALNPQLVRAAAQSRNPQPAARCSPQPRITLVDTSVYLKPTKLVDVALDVLARLAPCLNLGVRELGHKDLLDTIGADNRRK